MSARRKPQCYCLLGALVCATSCAQAPPAASGPPSPASESQAPPAEIEIEAAEAEPDVGVIETTESDSLRTDVPELARVACSVESHGGSWLSPVELGVQLTGPRFAQVSGVPGVVQLSAKGPSDGARLALEADGFALRGRAEGSEIVLTPNRAVRWGVVVPKSGARVKWVGSTSDRPQVSIGLIGSVTPPANQPFVWRPSCSELSLAKVEFDARTALGIGKPGRKQWIGTHDPFTITSEPSSGDSLTVRAPSGDHEVELLEARGGRAQILIDQENHLLFGWTDAANLRGYKLGAAKSIGYGSGRGKLGRRVSRSAKLRCERDVELVAAWGETSKQRAVVGAIRAGTEFWIVPPAGDVLGAVLVKLPSWISILSDAHLEVAAGLATSCATAER